MLYILGWIQRYGFDIYSGTLLSVNMDIAHVILVM